MNTRIDGEFIQLMIYFICHLRNKNYMLCLAQLCRNLVLIANSICSTVYCWSLSWRFDLSSPVWKTDFNVSHAAFLSFEKLDFTVSNCFLLVECGGWMQACVTPGCLICPSIHPPRCLLVSQEDHPEPPPG